ncbi:proclotting enzyme-like [Penaeus japonicus]|uniref:proclotting enzyme-like n=1 Tax=Penaeus japonicus TaxID=27405 RepID=UPI001C717A52|nr:proclotting enzyme-like [Penaeus japonicus]
MKVSLGDCFLVASLLAICCLKNAGAIYAVPECINPSQEVVVPVGETVALLSPNFPEAYPSRSRCGWNVRSEDQSYQLRIECPSFKLTKRNRNRRCLDFLSIKQERFCGEKGPALVSPSLDVDFRSDRRRNSRGFNCTVTSVPAPIRSGSPSCSKPAESIPVAPGEVLFFNSPNYPNAYPNRRCGWRFVPAISNMQLTLACNDFRMQNRVRKNRCQDFLSVKAKGKFCGRESPKVTVTDENLVVEFKANKRNNLSGFNCSVSGLQASPSTAAPIISTSKPVTNLPECGLKFGGSETKIVGGEATGENEYPWQAGLVFSGSSTVFCGGSIVDRTWILTAAHCAENIAGREGTYEVLIGAHNLKVSSNSESRHAIRRTVLHPNYEDETVDNDIALLEVEPIEFSDRVMPVCLPEQKDDYDDVSATVTGWGTLSEGGVPSDVLMEVTLPTMSNGKCMETYSDLVTKNMICAGLDAGGKDSCQGDSGGPMVTARGGRPAQFEQIGIVSWGAGCAKPGTPGVYARVTEYLTWIESTMSAK